MAVDASIPLQVQPLKLDDPLQQYGRLTSIQNAQAQNKLSDLQAQAAQTKLDENAAYKSALADTSNYDDKGNLSTEGIQNILKVAPEQGRNLLQLQRQNRLADAQIGYYGARTQKDQADTEEKQRQTSLNATYQGYVQAQSGDLAGALSTWNKTLPKDQQATKLEYIKDADGKSVGLRAYLADGTTHDTPDIGAAITQYRTLLAKPDTLITTQAANDRADKQNAVTIRGQDVGATSRTQAAQITADGRKAAAEVSASKPHYQLGDDGQIYSIDPATNKATPVTGADGKPVIGKQPVGPDILNAKIDAAKAFIQQHPRMIPDPSNPGKMKANPEVYTIQGYDNMERMANTPYVRKPGGNGGNVDTVQNPVQNPAQQGGKPLPSAPMNPKQRSPNTVYMTPKGAMKWTGTGWLPQ